MTRPRWTRKRAREQTGTFISREGRCKGKTSFATKREAKARARENALKDGSKPLKAYHCTECDRYHLTSENLRHLQFAQRNPHVTANPSWARPGLGSSAPAATEPCEKAVSRRLSEQYRTNRVLFGAD